jgi:hypothetical protein
MVREYIVVYYPLRGGQARNGVVHSRHLLREGATIAAERLTNTQYSDRAQAIKKIEIVEVTLVSTMSPQFRWQ